jgi:hemoglobin
MDRESPFQPLILPFHLFEFESEKQMIQYSAQHLLTIFIEMKLKGEKMKMSERKIITFLIAIFTLFGVVLTAMTGCSHQAPAASTPSLYERLGGINNIAVVVDDVIERSYVDPVFAANPRIHEAHQRFPKAVYKYNATALACQDFGGPQVYTGRGLKEAHQHLKVTETEWQALIQIFRDSMNSFKVPAKEQDEIIAILESTKDQIVLSSAQ